MSKIVDLLEAGAITSVMLAALSSPVFAADPEPLSLARPAPICTLLSAA